MNINFKPSILFHFSVLLLAAFLPTSSRGQQVQKANAFYLNDGTFSPATVARVYEVHTKQPMSADDQRYLAREFERTDTLIAGAIRSGKSAVQIARIRAQVDEALTLRIKRIKHDPDPSASGPNSSVFVAPVVTAIIIPIGGAARRLPPASTGAARKASKHASKFTLALASAKALKLTEAQVAQLGVQAAALDTMVVRNDNYDHLMKMKKQEMEGLSATLSEEQIAFMIHTAQYRTAKKWAEGDWEELVKRGLAGDFEQKQTTAAFLHYNVDFMYTKERYAAYPEQLSAKLQVVYNALPEALRRLKLARYRGTASRAQATGAAQGSKAQPAADAAKSTEAVAEKLSW